MIKLKFAAVLAAGAAMALSPAHVAAQDAPKPFYGIQIQVNSEGPEVTEVLPGYTADAVGFKVGDILLEAGNKPISQEVLQEYLKDVKPGDQLNFKVKRAGATVDLAGKAVAADGAPASTPQAQ